MQNLRVLITTTLFVLLLAVLAACIVETRPDRSMLIYVPPPVAQPSGHPNLMIQHGTIPGTIPEPVAPILMEEAQRSLATSTAISGTSPLTDTAPLTATLTPTTTPPVTATVTTTATQTVAPTGSATQSTLTPAPSGTATATLIPTRSG
ncbi:MAG: hypothetical protein KDE31_10910, partial [Caldilineaceae bacterium]|nr:hypothetical protein [Caldilineaceae bacterium]